MARANAPCKNCEKRYPNCHSKCEAYKDYKAVASKEQEIIRQAHKERDDYYEASPKYRKGKWGGGQR